MIIKTDTDQQNFYFLNLTDQNNVKISFSLEKDLIILGSSTEDDLIVNLPSIKKSHLKFSKNSTGNYDIENLSDTTVLINNNLLSQAIQINSDDIIQIDEIKLNYQIQNETEESNLNNVDNDDVEKTRFMQVYSMEDLPDKGKLIGVSGSFSDKVIEFDKDKISVGRDPSSDICIKTDGLSRAHAVIEVGIKEITIIDFNSTNGTFVNGKRITTQTVKPGALVQFANAVFKYELNSIDNNEPQPVKTGLGWMGYIIIILIIIASTGLTIFYTKKQKKEIKQHQKEIEKLVKKVETKAPPSPKDDLKMAEEAINNKAFDEALIIINTVLDRYPNNAKAILLQGKLQKIKINSEINNNYKLGLKYFETNEFDKSLIYLSQIDADFENYNKVREVIEKLNKLELCDKALQQAKDDFNSGNIEKSVESLNYVLNIISVHKEAIETKNYLLKIQNSYDLLTKDANNLTIKEQKQYLNEIISLVKNQDNYYYKYATKKLNFLSIGIDIKAEMYYNEATELLAKGNFFLANNAYHQAYILSPENLKFKLSYSENKQRCKKILKNYYQIANMLKQTDPSKTKLFWKKIVELGEDSNPYYKEAMENLAN